MRHTLNIFVLRIVATALMIVVHASICSCQICFIPLDIFPNSYETGYAGKGVEVTCDNIERQFRWIRSWWTINPDSAIVINGDDFVVCQGPNILRHQMRIVENEHVEAVYEGGDYTLKPAVNNEFVIEFYKNKRDSSRIQVFWKRQDNGEKVRILNLRPDEMIGCDGKYTLLSETNTLLGDEDIRFRLYGCKEEDNPAMKFVLFSNGESKKRDIGLLISDTSYAGQLVKKSWGNRWFKKTGCAYRAFTISRKDSMPMAGIPPIDIVIDKQTGRNRHETATDTINVYKP